MGDWSKDLRDKETGKPIPQPEPSPELRLALDCKEWNTLPRHGGLLDQPAGLLDKLSVVYRTFNAFRLWRNRKPGEEGKFIETYPEEYIIIESVEEMRKHGREQS